jgi:hypothetical protein
MLQPSPGWSMPTALFHSHASTLTRTIIRWCPSADSNTLYEGSCKVTESKSGGNTEPLIFAGIRGEKSWMTGPNDVVFSDLPNGGIFKWSTFALVVAE